MRDKLVGIVVGHLKRDAVKLRHEFQQRAEVQTRYAVVDDVFPVETAREISDAFPPVEAMRLLASFREK